MAGIDLHTEVISFGQHKGKRVVEIPLSYIRWLAGQKPIKFRQPKWIEIAKQELERRSYTGDTENFSEHSIERYSQRALRMSDGIITRMRKEFQKALSEGEWLDESTLIYADHKGTARWKVSQWKDAKKKQRYEVISYVYNKKRKPKKVPKTNEDYKRDKEELKIPTIEERM